VDAGDAPPGHTSPPGSLHGAQEAAHLHFLVTEGGVDEASVFHQVSSFDDSRLTEIFAREVLYFLVRKELLSPEWADRLLSW
jgi:hypothetical protein